MATNQYGQEYIGNDDYKGYLAAKASNGDRLAAELNNIVGNDGMAGDYSRLDAYLRGTKMPGTLNAQAWAKQYYNDYINGRKPGQAGADLDPDRTTGTGSSSSSYDANAINYWNGVIEQNRNQLGGLNGLLGELNKSTDSDYNTKRNELQSAYDRSKADYDSSTTRNQQQLQTNKNTIADRASQGLRGLLRTLGAMGAGGSSAALYNAPELVTAQANQERTGANQTFGENQQKLDTNWGNYQIDYDNDKKKLEDWKAGQLRENEQKVLNQKNTLLQTLADAYAQRGSAGAGAGNAINELTQQMMSNQNRLNELNRFTAPQYNGMRATYNAPSLSSYNTGNSSITTEVSDAPQAGMNATTSPTLAMLLGIKDRKDSNPYRRG